MKRSGRPAAVAHGDGTPAQQASRKDAGRVRSPQTIVEPAPHGPIVGGKWEWIWGVFLLAVTIVAYQQVWHAGYIWDDDKYVTANPLLTAADGLKRIWFSLDSPSQYFPLVYTSFRFEHALWGLNPAGYHWVNILLHGVNAVLVWRLLRALRVPGAWLAAALFALHPVQVESVAWITERKNVLMGFFFLLSLISWVRFVEAEAKERWKFYGAALVFYALALFSKTTACTIPAALLLILWLRRKPINLARLTQIAPFVVLGLAMGLLSIWWERIHQGTQGEIFSIGPIERILVASHAVWFYLGKLVWPATPRVQLSAMADFRRQSARLLLAAADGGGGVARLVRLGASQGGASKSRCCSSSRRSVPVLGFIMLYTFRYSWVADHYQYLACIGPLALAAAGISIAFGRLGKAKVPVIALVSAALLAALGLRTWKQGAIYADQETLWRATIAANPKSWMAYNNLATEVLKSGRTDEALLGYRKAIELDPEYAEAHYNLGNALSRAGQIEEATASYARALSLYPRFAQAHANFGAALLRLGRKEEAMAHLRAALEIDPRMAVAEQSLGNALLRSGQTTEGIAHLEKALEIDPTLPRIEHDLAAAFAQSGGAEQAAKHWKKALEANPDDGAANSALGLILAENGRVEESVAYLRKAAQAQPGSAEAHYNLAISLSRTGRLEEAITQYREVLQIRPDYAPAHVNLANSLAESGRYDEAVPEYNRALELKPNSATAYRNLATVLRRLGRDEEAEAALTRAQELARAASGRAAKAVAGRPRGGTLRRNAAATGVACSSQAAFYTEGCPNTKPLFVGNAATPSSPTKNIRAIIPGALMAATL